jgi:hypothetical protein
MDDIKLIEVYSGSLWEATLIKSMLEAADIQVFIHNASLQNFAFNVDAASRLRVMIDARYEAIAMEIIMQYHRDNQ